MIENYLAIDPGDRWVGCAVLQRVYYPSMLPVRSPRWCGQSIVLDTEGHSILQVIKALKLLIEEAEIVVCEDYDQRPSGFNAFNAGRTLRLLGALDVSVKSVGKRFVLVPPGSPKDAPKLWPHAKSIFLFKDHQQHATSAWRALGKYLMRRRPSLLTQFTGDLL